MLNNNSANSIPGITPVKRKVATATTSVSSRQKTQAQISRAMGIRRATEKWESKRAARMAAERTRDSYYNTDVDRNDILAEDNISEKAKAEYDKLCAAAEKAKIAEQQARAELWSAKYDTMTDSELQAAVVDIDDETEKSYVTTLQGKRVKDKRQKDLETMSAIGDPESVLYDPDFQAKSAYQSTKLTDGSLGESDTGYADIDYEFINGNQDISELIVGLERNYYYITDQERQIYNYWHNYDREHGTNVADNYLDLLQETLNDRDSEQDYNKTIKDNALKELLYAVNSGLHKYGNDVNTWWLKPEDYIATTSTEMTAQKAREGLADVGDFIKINDSSLGQLAYDAIENFTYNVPAKATNWLASQFNKYAGVIVGSVSTNPAANGEAYREMLNKGYTQEQARDYANSVATSKGITQAATKLAGEGLERLWNNSFTDEGMRVLGKLLDKTDWLGLTARIQSAIQSAGEDYALQAVTGEEQADEDDLQKTAQSAVTAKAMDKIFREMGASPEEISLDLRQPLLQSLKDPAAREKIEKLGSFTPVQLDRIIAGLENAGDQDEGIGTYVGDYYYGPSGNVRSKRYMQALADRAFSKPGWFTDDPGAAAIYEKYRRNTP